MLGREKGIAVCSGVVYIMNTMSFIRKIKRGGRVYLAEVENKRINGKCVQRHIRYVGREADGKTILSVSMSEAEVEQVKLYGPLLVLNRIAERIALRDALGGYGGEILSMVYAHCINYRSINQMEDWFARTDLNVMLNLEQVTEARLLEGLDFLEKCDSEQTQRAIFERVRKQYNLTDSGIIYDVTNTYLFGKKCPLGKFGHDKEGVKGRPLIQIGLGVTKDEGVGVFHKTFDGNVHDSKTLLDVLSSFKRYGLPPGTLVYDRGTTSARNLKYIKQLKWRTLCGIPLSGGVKKVWRPLMVRENLVNINNRIHFNRTTFYVITKPYKIEGVPGTLALCFNDRLKHDLRESRYDELTHAQQCLREHKVIKSGLLKFFDQRQNIKPAVLAAAEEFDGYSCIFCTDRLSKQEMVEQYFDKDLVEKAFRSLKGVVALRPIRHWLYQRVVGHVFICFLAYLLLSLLRLHLRKLNISPDEALRELETMYKVYLRDSSGHFKVSRVVTMTKKQEAILKAVDKRLLKL